MKQCPHCAEEIRNVYAVDCVACGKNVMSVWLEDEVYTSSQDASRASTKKCRHCPNKIDSQASSCPHCGKRQSTLTREHWIVLALLSPLIIAIPMMSDQPQTQPQPTTRAPQTTAPAAPDLVVNAGATLEQQFEAGIQGKMSCPQLYGIRNKLRRGKPDAYQERLNEQLKSVGCWSMSTERPATPPPAPLTLEDIDTDVHYADCDELRTLAKRFYSVLDRSGMRSATPEDIQRQRSQLGKFQDEFWAVDVPPAKGNLERPSDLLYSTTTQYGTVARLVTVSEYSHLQMTLVLETPRELQQKMEAAFASAGCPVK